MENGTTMNGQIFFFTTMIISWGVVFFLFLSGLFIRALEVHRDLDKEYTEVPLYSCIMCNTRSLPKAAHISDIERLFL